MSTFDKNFIQTYPLGRLSLKESYLQPNIIQLLLFPVEIQDKIIEEISYLNQCTQAEIDKIIGYYLAQERL